MARSLPFGSISMCLRLLLDLSLGPSPYFQPGLGAFVIVIDLLDSKGGRDASRFLNSSRRPPSSNGLALGFVVSREAC